ncbi:MAG: hypothetical protein ACRELT_16250 [Longimicrobiales bacterium]
MHAHPQSFRHLALLGLAALTAACSDGGDTTAPVASAEAIAFRPDHTMGSGSSSTLLGRATFSDGENLKVKRMTGDWHVEVKAHREMDIAVQQIVFQPGGYSGWHSHPGPVFIQVVSGTMTFYDSTDPTCTPIVRTVGQGFLDVGDHAHIARNETSSPAVNVVTYLAPPGAALRIDEPAPGNCPF